MEDKYLKRLCALILVTLWAWSVVGQTPAEAATPKNSTEIAIYPNPITSYVRISDTCTFKILDITGGEVFAQREIRLPDEKIYLPHIATGIYFIQIYSGKEMTAEQLLTTKKIKILN
jgi:hypothetical protein